MASILETYSVYQLECRKENLLKEIEKIDNEIEKRNTLDHFENDLKSEINLENKKVKIKLINKKDNYEITPVPFEINEITPVPFAINEILQQISYTINNNDNPKIITQNHSNIDINPMNNFESIIPIVHKIKIKMKKNNF